MDVQNHNELKGELVLISKLPTFICVLWAVRKQYVTAGTKRSARTARPWHAAAEDLYWSSSELELLVRYRRRQKDLSPRVTRGLLVSLRLYLWLDDDSSWLRPSRRGDGIQTHEQAATTIVHHCTGYRVDGHVLAKAAKSCYDSLVGNKKKKWAKHTHSNVPVLRTWLQEEPGFVDVQLQRDTVAVQLAQQAHTIHMQLELLVQLRQGHSKMYSMCEELGDELQVGIEEKKQLRKELRIAQQQCSDARVVLQWMD